MSETYDEADPSRPLKIAIVGDYNPNFLPHVATDAGLVHAADALSVRVDAQWIATPDLVGDAALALAGFDGL